MSSIEAAQATRPATNRVLVLGALDRLNESRSSAFWATVTGQGGRPRKPTRPVEGVAWLLTGRADVIVAADFRWSAVAAGLVRPRDSAFYVLLTEPPKALSLRDRLVLRLADGVLVDGDATARVVSHAAFPAKSVVRIVPRYPVLEVLRSSAGERPAAAGGKRRIVFSGSLSPQSGAPDLLTVILAWAEAHPAEEIELAWIGTGDLAGVLAAQPVPPNLSQVFLGELDRDQAASVYATSWLLAVPGPDDTGSCRVAGAFAAGLPVLASRWSAEARLLVTDNVNGWLYDPAKTGAMPDALDRALAASGETVAMMGARARAALQGPVSGPVLGSLRPTPSPSRPAKAGLGLHSAPHRAR